MRTISLFAAIYFSFINSLSAKLPPTTLEKIISFSDFIFVGRIYSRGDEPVLRGSFNSWGRLQIDVEHTICGHFFKKEWPEGRVEVLYPLNPVERPAFDLGSRYLFFWKDGYSGPQLAPSFYGAARIENGLVHMESVSNIRGTIAIEKLENIIDCPNAAGVDELFR